MIVLIGIGVFFLAAVLDFADSRNTMAVAEGRPHAAATWSVVMYVVSLTGLLLFLKVSFWLAIPEVLGLYVGSYLAVSREPRPSRDG